MVRCSSLLVQVLGVYDWAGTNPLPPEIWMLPYVLPFHPGQQLHPPAHSAPSWLLSLFHELPAKLVNLLPALDSRSLRRT